MKNVSGIIIAPWKETYVKNYENTNIAEIRDGRASSTFAPCHMQTRIKGVE